MLAVEVGHLSKGRSQQGKMTELEPLSQGG